MDEKMMNKTNLFNKKAQITIFIIFGSIIVVGLALLFILFNKSTPELAEIENPQAYIESCVKDFTKEAVDILSVQGGDIVPEGSTMYKSRDIAYLCYNENYYIPCINQRPMLIKHIEKEITNYIRLKTENCFNSLKSKLEEKNYQVEIGEMDLETELKTGQVAVNINRDFKMSKGEETRTFNIFKMKMAHPIYNLAEVALEIANQEAEYCNFDILGFMVFYPEYDLNKFRPGNSDVIYDIRDVSSNQRFMFAVRSCALPPGF